MSISGFTFLKNPEKLGYPFLLSIQSALSLCDEFIIALGPCDDNTLEKLHTLPQEKLKILHTHWNHHIPHKGYTYAQQKMIAQFNCQGDWVLYLEADEILHEKDLPSIKAAAAQAALNVEALVFDYYHFYGNVATYLDSPAWYRRAPRMLRNTLRSYAPDGLYWLILDKNNRRARYPRAALAHAHIYHYGWVRTEKQMQEKLNEVKHLWGNHTQDYHALRYANIDPSILRLFQGQHPNGVLEHFPEAAHLFPSDPHYRLNSRDKRQHLKMWIEKWLHVDLSRKHFHLI